MRMVLAALSLVMALDLALAQPHYVHRKLDWFTDMLGMSLSDDGRMLYVGTKDDPELTYKTYDLYVDGLSYTADMFVGRHNVVGGSYEPDGNLWFHAYFYDAEGKWRGHAFRNKTDYVAENWGMAYRSSYWKVNARGDVAIQLSIGPDVPYESNDLWLNDRNIGREVLGAGLPRYAGAAQLLDTGDLFWVGRSSSTGYAWDIFLNEGNLTASILGTNRLTGKLYALSTEDYAWQGGGANTQGYQNVFRGTENYGARVFGSVRYEARLEGYSKNGHVVWWAKAAGAYAPSDIYRDEENLSAFLGDGRVMDYFAIVGDDGRVMWEGWSPELGLEYYDVFVNQTNISGPRLGWDPTRRGDAHGFTSNGRAVWMGYTAKHGWNVFLDDVNVTENAFEGVPGTRWISRMGVSANARGDVLWLAKTNNYYAPWEVWYSQLVPEPLGCSGVSVGLMLLIVLRKHRSRSCYQSKA